MIEIEVTEVTGSQEKRRRRFLVAIVGGQKFNEYQTKQAIADGKVCHCGRCICCEILRKSRMLGW